MCHQLTPHLAEGQGTRFRSWTPAFSSDQFSLRKGDLLGGGAEGTEVG